MICPFQLDNSGYCEGRVHSNDKNRELYLYENGPQLSNPLKSILKTTPEWVSMTTAPFPGKVAIAHS